MPLDLENGVLSWTLASNLDLISVLWDFSRLENLRFRVILQAIAYLLPKLFQVVFHLR